MLDRLTLQAQWVVTPVDASLEAFLLAQEASRHTPKTLVHYRYTVGGFVTWLKAQGVQDVASITPAHVRLYLVSLQKRGLKDTTQHAQARGIKAWLNWLVREGDLERSPMQRVTMPKLEGRIPPPFSPEEVQALLSACDRHTPIGARNFAIVLTLLDTGLRAAEFVPLRVGNIDARSGLVTVFGKGQKQRQVRVGARARGAIVKMLGYRPGVKPGEPLWMAYEGLTGSERGPLILSGLQISLRRLGERAGVVPCAPHRFRRTFALWCLRG